jgi:pimeloyl-ACP methyl ester carboxylesterase
VLFHQARSSRGEYRPLIPRLAELGYGCLAVDLRVGGSSRTVRQARGRVKPPTYLDALPDIEDALAFAREHYAQGKLVACGSSFSASLLLHLAATKPEALDGVVAFSPGEYFTNLGKDGNWVLESARGVRQPAFLSASLADGEEWLAIFEALGSTSKTAHRPVARGPSGAMALWEESPGSAECRQALEAFLQQHFPVATKGSGG